MVVMMIVCSCQVNEEVDGADGVGNGSDGDDSDRW